MSVDSKNQFDKAMKEMGCFDETVLTVADTPNFMRMARDAEKNKRNKSVYVDKLHTRIDPHGIHIFNSMFSMLHNDIEMRGQWLVKLIGREDPIYLWLDIDFQLFNECTSERRVSNALIEDLMEQGRGK